MLATFLSLTASDTASVVDYAGDLITDLSPLLLIVVGVAVGVFIFWAIVNSIKH
jgi:hypothetical protein